MTLRIVPGLAAVACLLAAPAALAIPIQPAPTAPTSTGDQLAGPRRPGLIPSTSSAAGISTGGDAAGGQRRPIPGQSNDTLSAEK